VAEGSDEARLVSLAAKGDRDAFARLVERHWRAACASAYAVLGNAADAEEVAQETFVSALEKLRRLRDPGAFGGWIWRIARDTALKRLRRMKRLKLLGDTPDGREEDERPFAAMLEREERAQLMAALNELPQDMRDALVMRYWEELEYEEMARRTGVTPAALYQRVCRGLRRLRERLQPGRED
jgi:RNA polymerase sigma-70 factor, ECF subfamily